MGKETETVNDRIAYYRKLAGFTQVQAASLLDMKRNTYARLEKTGRPSPEQLKQIAELFRISVAMLLYGDDPGAVSGSSKTDRITFKGSTESDIMPLTTTEINAIRIVRDLDEADAKMVIDYINEIYRKKILNK